MKVRYLLDDAGKPYEVSDAVHCCSVCGTVGLWGPSWQWFGSYKDLDEGKPIVKVCSEACKKKAPWGRLARE